MEEYRVCYENYEISNLGNCRRLLKNGNYKQVNGSILATGGGYKYFQINKYGKRTNKLFHHLVAKCFIGERPDNLVIDHIDRNPLNNKVENLRYVSQQINSQNTDRYRNDVIETDKIKRRNLLERERENKKRRADGIPQRNSKGEGSISKLKWHSKPFRATIIIKKIKYTKYFTTEEEAKNYIQLIKSQSC